MPPDIHAEIKTEISEALDRLGAPAALRGIVGSWLDPLDDASVLELLKDYNAKPVAPQSGDIHVMLSGKPGDLRFIEVEDGSGHSINVGDLRKAPGENDDLYELVIPRLTSCRTSRRARPSR